MNKDFLIYVFDKLNERINLLKNDAKTELYTKARAKNNWFIPMSIDLAFKGLDNYLNVEKLRKWSQSIRFVDKYENIRNIGIVMAGNIPMVGFHDLLCVIFSGHTAKIKLSSQDDILIRYILDVLIDIEPELKTRFEVVDRLVKPDAVIATGSDNSARYFNYYFKEIPHIIRKNRTSIGILKGTEDPEILMDLGKDILTYFGLGCRNVSKLLVPRNYNFEVFFNAIADLDYVMDTQKYVNNYDYNKSIFLVNREEFYDNGFLMIRKSDQLVSPVSVLYYHEYEDPEELNGMIKMNMDKIQCVVSDGSWFKDSISFGTTQMPELWDYADNVNTIEFLNSL